MRSNRFILVLAVALPALGACGGPAAIDAAVAESLQQQVRELATVTRDGNLQLAVSQAEALKTEVQQAQDSGAVTSDRAGRIQANIDAFIESIQEVEAPAPVTPSTEPAPAPPTSPAPAEGVDEGGANVENAPTDVDREAAEEAAKEARKRAEEAQKQAEKEAEEQLKQEEEDGKGKDD